MIPDGWRMTFDEAISGPLAGLRTLFEFSDTHEMRDRRRHKHGLSTNNTLADVDNEATSSSDEDTEPQPLG